MQRIYAIINIVSEKTFCSHEKSLKWIAEIIKKKKIENLEHKKTKWVRKSRWPPSKKFP
jgi:ribosomal protein L15E